MDRIGDRDDKKGPPALRTEKHDMRNARLGREESKMQTSIMERTTTNEKLKDLERWCEEARIGEASANG